MSDSIIKGFSEMKDIYLTQILTEGKDYDGDGKVEDPKREWRDSKNNAIRKALGKPPEDDYEPEDDEDDENEEDDEDEKPKSKRKHKKDEEKDDEMKTESFSNWRSDLYEVISKLEPKVKEIDNDEPISEKKVVNKVVLNPVVTEKFTLIGEQELDEEFLLETASVAAEYFANLGLNEHGLEMVIDYLGEEKFLEYVFYVTEDYLLTEEEARQLSLFTKSGKPVHPTKELRGAPAAARFKAAEPAGAPQKKQKVEPKPRRTTPGQKRIPFRDAEGATRTPKKVRGGKSKTDDGKYLKMHLAKKVSIDKGNQIVKAASQQQNPKAPDGIAGIAQRIHKIWKEGEGARTKGWERHDAAAQKLNAAASKAHHKYKEGIKRGKTPFQALGSLFASFDDWVGGLINEGFDLSTISAGDLVERYNFLLEKAVSEQQQKIFGLALAVKLGEVSRSKVSEKVLEIADSMSEAEIRKFASTKHKGIPHRK